MPSYNDPTTAAIALFCVTAALLLLATYFGQSRTGRMLALSSIAVVCGANYAMLKAYNGEPELFYERAGPIERKVINRRGSFEFVDKHDGSDGAAHSGQGASQGPAHGEEPNDEGSQSGGQSGSARSGSPLSRMLSQLTSVAHAERNPGTDLEPMRDCTFCPEMVLIERGFYRMGAAPGDHDAEPSELPSRLITVSRRFAIGRSEVTVAQYMAFARATGRATPACFSHDATTDFAAPISCVTRADADAYIGWLNVMTGRTYRLPTEAEWEWAARGGSQERYSSGNTLQQTRGANGYGLMNIHGGVAEIVAGCWSDTLSKIPTDASTVSRANDCKRGVLRDAGGNEPASLARLSARRSHDPQTRMPHVGFRIARNL